MKETAQHAVSIINLMAGQQRQAVTAPSEAEETVLAYLAKTPVL